MKWTDKATWLGTVLVLLLAFVIWSPQEVRGTGTWSLTKLTDGVYKYSILQDTTTSGVTSFTDTATSQNIDGWVLALITAPSGVTSPTDNWDLYLKDSDDCDVFGAETDDRDTTNVEQAMPKIGNGYEPRYVEGPLTLSISGNEVIDAEIQIDLYFQRR